MILEKGRHPFPIIIDLDDSDWGRDDIMAALAPIWNDYLVESSAKTTRDAIVSQYEFYKFVEAIDDHLGDFVTFLISKPIEEY